MPNCMQCTWRDGHRCRAQELASAELKRPLPPLPSGACTYAIVESYLPLILKNHRVLEVGCGTWSKIRDHAEKVGAHYEGLDVKDEYYGIKCIATRIENLANLSYENNQFDFVIGNQTMEHWGEYGCDPLWGLYQCFRVAKPGASVFMNVPIHFHGTKQFLHGDLEAIKNLFAPFSTTIEIGSWGQDTTPLKPFYAHPKFSLLKNKGAYVIDVRAVKNKPLPHNINNRRGFTGRMAQLLHYSPSYNFYRLIQKVFNG